MSVQILIRQLPTAVLGGTAKPGGADQLGSYVGGIQEYSGVARVQPGFIVDQVRQRVQEYFDRSWGDMEPVQLSGTPMFGAGSVTFYIASHPCAQNTNWSANMAIVKNVLEATGLFIPGSILIQTGRNLNCVAGTPPYVPPPATNYVPPPPAGTVPGGPVQPVAPAPAPGTPAAAPGIFDSLGKVLGVAASTATLIAIGVVLVVVMKK